ncbi:hypothetical protein NEDG_00264 [Nematocida displodere]|uniref:Uncharacterized protein n=1 Tax=Nematocida displodere TaxID=1805483 RepID=A0A177ELD2_9MICR|nr:hypothetical protein NEDG_00264 [Nematocida displodere]
MAYQQGSSADHIFEKGSLEYLGLFFFFSGILWVVLSGAELLQLFPGFEHRVTERVAAILVYTALYILAISILYPFGNTRGART